jgi:hypothetical protein
LLSPAAFAFRNPQQLGTSKLRINDRAVANLRQWTRFRREPPSSLPPFS